MIASLTVSILKNESHSVRLHPLILVHQPKGLHFRVHELAPVCAKKQEVGH